jgi:hypothetical protein
METPTQADRQDVRQSMPDGVRWAVYAVVAALFAGALYLLSVRGEALLLDLSALGQRIFCF